MKCPNCGEEIANDSKYCESCGYKLKRNYGPLDRRRIIIWVMAIMGFLLGFFFFYIDNPAAHNGAPEVVYQGEDENGQLRFDFYFPNLYHSNYAWNSIKVEVYREYPLISSYCGYVYCTPHNLDPYRKSILFDEIHESKESQLGDGTFHWEEYKRLNRGTHYVAIISGTHKGVLFNRPAKKLQCDFTLEKRSPARTPKRTMFSVSDRVYCDGVYHGPEWEYDYRNTALYLDFHYGNGYYLGGEFNRNYFRVSFDFYVLSTESSTNPRNNLIMLGTSHRVFGLKFGDNNTLLVTTNNGDHCWCTSISYVLETWQHVDLLYDHGTLYINDDYISIGELNEPGDNVLSSIDFSTGNCFYGYIKNLVVKSDWE